MTSASAIRAHRPSPSLSLGVSAVLVVLAALAVWFRGINQDSAWYLYMIDVWRAGGTPYIDAVETNPPLILLITYLPAWLASALGVSSVTVFLAFVFLLALGSAAQSARLAQRLWPHADPALRGLVLSALIFLTLAFPKSAFGQREHLAVLLTLPYVWVAALRATGVGVGRGEAGVIGILGALGFALKPHFVLAWLAVEAVVAVAVRGRVIRPETVAVVATGVLYALVVWFAFPQYFGVANEVWQVYGGLNSPALRLIQLRELQAAVVVVALAAVLRVPRPYLIPLVVVAAAALGYLASSLLQLKGWDYQMLPAQVFLALFFCLALVSLLDATPIAASLLRGGARGLAASMVVVLVVLGAKYTYEASQRLPNDPLPPLRALVEREAPEGPLAVLSMRTLVYPAFPLVNYTGAAWALRQHSMWYLPGLYAAELVGPSDVVPFRSPEAMAPLEKRLFHEILSDLCRTPPRLLMIEIAPHYAPAGRRALDLAAYYAQDERFVRLMDGYDDLAVVTPFRVLRRRETASCQ